MKIGVLASQGAFAEHIAKLRQLGIIPFVLIIIIVLGLWLAFP